MSEKFFETELELGNIASNEFGELFKQERGHSEVQRNRI